MIDRERAGRVRLLGLDVDGVLTDNAVFLGEIAGERVEFKRFDIQDGLGHVLLAIAGLEVIWVSGRQSTATSLRGTELGVGTVLQVPASAKVPAIEAELSRRGLSWDQFAFVGDDLADLRVFERAGLAIAVANAIPRIKSMAHHVTELPGGRGAVREVIDLLLEARGQTDQVIAAYCAGSTGPS
ncbi:MAG TPA: HAD hydrolase family protein [Gemmatimonadales bacterium]|nr:HAD hydrolase family protein [Gemmatimonadales bacterium]